MVPYVVCAFVAVTVVCVVCVFAWRLLGCEGDGSVGYGECVYGWYTWVRCLASAGDVLKMSVVRGGGGVCDMCVCLVRGRVGGEWVTGLGFTNSGGTWGKWGFGGGGVGVTGVGGEWVGVQGLGGWDGIMSVCVVSLDYLC